MLVASSFYTIAIDVYYTSFLGICFIHIYKVARISLL